MHANDARDAIDAYSTTCASGRSSARLVEADPRPGRRPDRGHRRRLSRRARRGRTRGSPSPLQARQQDRRARVARKASQAYVERHVHDFSNGVAERLATALARVDGRARSTPAASGRIIGHLAAGLRAGHYERASGLRLDDAACVPMSREARRARGLYSRHCPSWRPCCPWLFPA